MKKKIVFVTGLCLASALASCRGSHDDVPSYQVVVDKMISEYSDSSFFSDIRCMQYYDNKIYVSDVARRDIAVLNNDLTLEEYIGRGGRGPDEFVVLDKFYISRDTLYVIDYASGFIKGFYKQHNVNNIACDVANDTRFFYADGLFFVPVKTGKGLFYTLDKKQNRKQYYGELHHKGNDVKTVTINGRNLLSYNEYIIAVPDGLPFIEKYDKNTKRLIETYDLSFVPFMAENLRYTENEGNKNDKSYHILVRDVCIYEDDIFLLCSNFGKIYKAQTILHVSLKPKIAAVAVYTLPGRYYNSLCATPTHLVAINGVDSRIETFLRKSP